MRFVWLQNAFFVFMVRYSIIKDKRKREIVLLRGRGCAYKKCAFCDYHLDRDPSDEKNYALNRDVLAQVTGEYGEIEIINSGSVFELDGKTRAYIKDICREKGISVIHFELHFMYADKIPELRKEFDGFTLKTKLGLETFDRDLRENVLHKGIEESDPERIARGFDEANFLFGITGQNTSSMLSDIELGLKYFERICVNIMCENSTDVKPDKAVIEAFMRDVYPRYIDNERVDILVNNTDFGVGA